MIDSYKPLKDGWFNPLKKHKTDNPLLSVI